jgi:hypothetical protein
MNQKAKPRGSYTKYRTFYLPKPYVDLLLVTAHTTPLDGKETEAVQVGLSVINDILSKSDIFSRDDSYPFHVIPLYSPYLHLKYGYQYNTYMRWLLNNNVVWHDHYFKGHSTHYYLHPIEQCELNISSKISLYKISLGEVVHTYCLQNKIQITPQTLANRTITENRKNRIFTDWYKIKLPINGKNKKYLTHNYTEDSTFINNAPKHIKSMGMYYRNNLAIDADGAIQHTLEKYTNDLQKSTSPEQEASAFKRYSTRIASIRAIENGKKNKSLRFNRNSKNNRLDTNLTNMASDLRPFIIGFDKMANLDLVNSQPVLFNVLLQKYREKATQAQIEELDTFRRLTTSGKWYERLSELYGMNRDKAKKVWMAIAYSKNASFKPQKKIFKGYFPFISAIIQEVKKTNHANFAIELQKIESNVFIDKICKVLVGEGIIPYTIHDGLFVPKASTDRTKEIMLEELKKVIGDYPTIKVS